MSLAWIACPTPLAMLPPVTRKLIGAMRHWAVANQAGRWPVGVLREQVRCTRAAAHLQLLIEEIGHAWPDPFCLAPPCCRQTSHDESLIAGMAMAAAAGDRPGFDRLCAEMLGGDVRDRLFLSLGLVGRALGVAPSPEPG